jgi:hypothetical protein
MPKYSNAEMPEYRHTGMSALPSVVFGFALLQYFQRLSDGRNTLSVQECMYGTNSPGHVQAECFNQYINTRPRLPPKTR